MSDIVLSPTSSIEADDNLCDYLRNKFQLLLQLYGVDIARGRLVRTTNASGDVMALNNEYITVKVMLFDRNSSSAISLQGNKLNDNVGGKRPRAYCLYDAAIVPGDYLLIDFNSADESYSQKYLVQEKEAHEINCIIFYTLYLTKVT